MVAANGFDPITHSAHEKRSEHLLQRLGTYFRYNTVDAFYENKYKSTTPKHLYANFMI